MFMFGTEQRPSLQVLPLQNIELALVRPIACSLHEASTDGILDDILPFLIVTLAPPQLRIPEVPLPDRAVSRLYPLARRG